MEFPHIDNALGACRGHLSGLNVDIAQNAKIESLLVSSVVLLIVSHYEAYIGKQFAERAALSGDKHVANFVKHHTARRFWNPVIGKITKALGEFGGEYRQEFTGRVENTIAHAAWDNIVCARNGIVHEGTGANMTLRDLEMAYSESHIVLTALRASLGLSEVSAE